MPLSLLPAQLEDFDDLTSHASRFGLGDDLVANPVPTCWPVTNRSEAIDRAQWHFTRQRKRFLKDKTAHFLKVVDDDNEIIAIARWHLYSRGYFLKEHQHWEPLSFSEKEDEVSKGWNYALHDKILNRRDQYRDDWIIPPGAPCWILTHLVTRSSQRRKGAAKMLVHWGVEKAEETNVRAYLEAGVAGVDLYRSSGFEAVGEPVEIKIDDDKVFRMVIMAYIPRSLRSG